MSVICKSFERIIANYLMDYLDNNNILASNQYGFRRRHSTLDQLLLTYNDVSLWIDQGFDVDVILFDFAKAFDTVCHQILLSKLESIGIQGRILNWLKDFLLGRMMRVRVFGNNSSERLVTSGVPQGSVLGPILFLIFVNNINQNLLSQCVLFADDLKIYMKVRRCSDSQTDICLLLLLGTLQGKRG